MHHLRWLSCLLAGLLAACEADDPDPGELALPTVVRVSPEALEAHLGEPLTLSVRITDAAGAPAVGYESEWFPQGGTIAHPEPGLETLTFVPATLDRVRVEVRVRVCSGPRSNPRAHCPEVRYLVSWVRVWGGPPVAIKTPVKSAALRVGEVRPLQALVLATGSQSHVAATYVIDDEDVASVDALGVVTGLAAGTTTLRLQAGDVQASMALTVSAGALGPPADAVIVPIVEEGDDLLYTAGASARHEGRLVVDTHAYPWLTYRTLARVAGVPDLETRGAWVAAWTGSGFGYEYVGDGWDDLYYPQLAVDDRGTGWLAFWSRINGEYAVMRRAAPGSWVRTPLPAMAEVTAAMPPELAGDRTKAFEKGSEAFIPDRFGDSIPLGLWPRPGGGAWVAYSIFGPSIPGRHVRPCRRRVRLSTLEGDEAQTEDIAELEFGGGALGSTCVGAIGNDKPFLAGLFIVPHPAVPTGRPQVLALDARLDLGSLDLLSHDGTWGAQRLIGSALNDLAPDGLTLARPEHAGLPTGVVWSARAPFFATLDALIAGDPPEAGFGSGAFAVAAGGSTFAGGTLGPWSVRRPWGGATIEDLTARFFPVGDPYLLEPYHRYTPVYGAAGNDARLHVTWGAGLYYGVLDVPELASPGDPEADGRRLGAEALTPVPLRPPLVRADGSRLLATDQGLFASSGVDAPFTLVHARDGTWEPDLFEAQGALWGFHWIGPTVDVIRSEDGGTTFVKVRSIAVAGAPKQLAVTTDAVPFLLVGDALLRAPTDDPGSALDVFAAAPPQPGSTSRVLVHGAGVVVLNAYDGLEVRHYASDGTLTATGKTLELRQGYVLLDTAAVAPDGRVCLLEVAYTGSGLGLGAVCSIDGFDHFTRATLPTSDWFEPAPLVVLRDGSFVFGATLTRAFEERRAVVSFSADGSSWTEATDVRPQGGFGQKVLGLAGEADGGVLAVLGDNGSLRAWTGGDVRDAASYDTVIMRLGRQAGLPMVLR